MRNENASSQGRYATSLMSQPCWHGEWLSCLRLAWICNERKAVFIRCGHAVNNQRHFSVPYRAGVDGGRAVMLMGRTLIRVSSNTTRLLILNMPSNRSLAPDNFQKNDPCSPKYFRKLHTALLPKHASLVVAPSPPRCPPRRRQSKYGLLSR